MPYGQMPVMLARLGDSDKHGVDTKLDDMLEKINSVNSYTQVIDKKIDEYVMKMNTLDNKFMDTRNGFVENDKKITEYFSHLNDMASNRCKSFDEQFKKYEQHVIEKYNELNSELSKNSDRILELNKKNGEILDLATRKTNVFNAQCEKYNGHA
jgi:peptidoglycan hydrolase CwlO-like protein